MSAPRDLTGLRFGLLTPIKPLPRTSHHRRWRCRCACGKISTVYGTNLVQGSVTHCGCQRAVRQESHGLSRTPEYKIWTHMKNRCTPDTCSSEHYADRGIKVCKRWVRFSRFIKDMGRRPSPKHSIGRINNGKGYSPSNCRWETVGQQMRNTRRTRMLTAFGETKCIGDWASDRRCSIDRTSLSYRLKIGISPEEAITRPAFFFYDLNR
jgi:hypothetical protein